MEINVDTETGKLIWFIDDIDITNKLSMITFNFPNSGRKQLSVEWRRKKTLLRIHGNGTNVEQDIAEVIFDAHGIRTPIQLDKMIGKAEVVDYQLEAA